MATNTTPDEGRGSAFGEMLRVRVELWLVVVFMALAFGAGIVVTALYDEPAQPVVGISNTGWSSATQAVWLTSCGRSVAVSWAVTDSVGCAAFQPSTIALAQVISSGLLDIQILIGPRAASAPVPVPPPPPQAAVAARANVTRATTVVVRRIRCPFEGQAARTTSAQAGRNPRSSCTSLAPQHIVRRELMRTAIQCGQVLQLRINVTSLSQLGSEDGWGSFASSLVVADLGS